MGQIGEFYGATECNCSIANMDGKVSFLTISVAVSNAVGSGSADSVLSGWSMWIQQSHSPPCVPNTSGEGGRGQHGARS